MARHSNFSIENDAITEPIRERLRQALKAKGISYEGASTGARLGSSFVHEFIHFGHGGSFEALERICAAAGISWEWVMTGAGEVSGLGPAEPVSQLNQEALEVTIHAALQAIFPDAPESAIRGLALLLIGSAKVPPGHTLDDAKRNTIRNEISAALRLFFLHLDQRAVS